MHLTIGKVVTGDVDAKNDVIPSKIEIRGKPEDSLFADNTRVRGSQFEMSRLKFERPYSRANRHHSEPVEHIESKLN